LEGGEGDDFDDFADDDDDDDDVGEKEIESYKGLLVVDDDEESSRANKRRKTPGGGEAAATSPPSTPPNFSRLTSDTNADADSFPLAKNATGRVEVTIRAGEGAFIPAGWWHEVFSSDEESRKGEVGHLAINYWYVGERANA